MHTEIWELSLLKSSWWKPLKLLLNLNVLPMGTPTESMLMAWCFFLAEVDADNSFAVYKVPFYFEVFWVHLMTPLIFLENWCMKNINPASRKAQLNFLIIFA